MRLPSRQATAKTARLTRRARLPGAALVCLACSLGAAAAGQPGSTVTASLPSCVLLTLDGATVDVVIEERVDGKGPAHLEAGLLSPDPEVRDPVVDLASRGECLEVTRSASLLPSRRLRLALTLPVGHELRVDGKDLELGASAVPAEENGERLLAEGPTTRLKLAATIEDSTLSLGGPVELQLSAARSQLLLETLDGPADLKLTETVVEARNLLGDLVVTAATSSLTVNDQTGSATARLAAGSLTVNRGKGRLSANTQDAQVAVLARRGELSLAGAGGKVSVVDLPQARHPLRIEMQGGQVEARSVTAAMKLKLSEAATADLEDLAENLTVKASGESRIEARRISTANLRLENSFLDIRTSHWLKIKAKGSILQGDMVDGLEADLAESELRIEMGPHPIDDPRSGNVSLVTFPLLQLTRGSHALLDLPGPCELWLPPDKQIPPDHLDPGPCPVRRGTEWREGGRSSAYDSEGRPFRGHPLKVIADLDESSSLALRAAP